MAFKNRYEVTCDGTVIGPVGLINPKVTQENLQISTFTFTMPPGHPHYNSINRLNSHISVSSWYDPDTFHGIIVEEKIDFDKNKHFYCEDIMTYLKRVLLPQKKWYDPIPQMVSKMMEQYNRVSDVKIKISCDFPGQYNQDEIVRYTDYESVWSVLQGKFLKPFGGYLNYTISGNWGTSEYSRILLNWVVNPNENTTQTIEFGENLLDFVQKYDDSDIVSVIYPFGAKLEDQLQPENPALEKRVDISSVTSNGSLGLSRTDLKNKYGYRAIKKVWDDVHEPSILKKRASDFLLSQIEKYTLKVKAIDLHQLDERYGLLKVNQKICVRSRPHDLNAYFVITKRVLPLLNLEDTEYTMEKVENVSNTLALVDSI